VRIDERTAWYNIAITSGFGPAKCQHVWRRLEDLGHTADVLVGMDETSLAETLSLSVGDAMSLEEQFRSLIPVPSDNDRWRVRVPGDEGFPNTRFGSASPPLSAVLWMSGAVELAAVSTKALGISGSRDASEEVLEIAEDIGRMAGRDGILVVSGLAAGVDSAAHRGALRTSTGTIGVLASGIAHAGNVTELDEDAQLCLVSEFPPDDPWAPRRAMQRNATIAALSDRVVIVAASSSGGTWEMGQLCLKRRKSLFVVDLPREIAEGNQLLIRSGATPLAVQELDACLQFDEDGEQVQPTLF